MPAGEPIRAALNEPGARVDHVDALLAACAGPVADILWRTCRWSPAPPNDARYAAFWVGVDDGRKLSVVVVSDPVEPVLTQVTSDRTFPGAERYIGAAELQRLERLDFRRTRSQTHFIRRDIVAFRADAERLARDVLTIMFDVFGYRGMRPIDLERSPDSRPRRDGARCLRADGFATLARKAGFVVRPDARGEQRLYRNGRQLVAVPGDRLGPPVRPWMLALRAPLRSNTPLPPNIVDRLAARIPGVRFTGHDGSASVEIMLSLDRGLSLGWLAAQCTRLEQTRDLAERAMSQASTS